MMPFPGISRKNSQFVIVCSSNVTSVSPLDGTTYFFGGWAATTTALLNSIYVKRPCRIKEVRLAVLVAGTLGTTEQATVSVRVNDTTDTTVSSVVQYNVLGPIR